MAAIMSFKVLNDIEPEPLEDDGTDELEIETTNDDEAFEEVIDSFKNHQAVISTFQTIRHHIKRFGITKEFLHLVNSEGNLNQELGMTLPYFEDDSIEVIEVPDTAETEVVLEGLMEKIDSLKEKMRETFNSVKARITNFLKAYFTRLGIWNRKLDNIKKEKFQLDINETAFENSKLKTYKLDDIKNLIKTINGDIKDPLPNVVGKEYVWKHFPKALGLLGLQVDIYTKDAYYLGQKLDDVKETNIVIRKNDLNKVKKERSLLINLGWDWDKSKDLMSTIKMFLDTIKTVDRQCQRVITEVDRFLNSIVGDYWLRTSQESIDTKRAEVIYNNAMNYFLAFITVRRAMIKACFDIVDAYYTILKKAKPVKL